MLSLNKIGISCVDIEQAINFYVDVMGMQLEERFTVENSQDYIYLRSGDVLFELMPTESNKDLGLHHLSFNTNHLENDSKVLVNNGVEQIRPAFDVGVGNIRLAFFSDPDSVNIQLYERNQ